MARAVTTNTIRVNSGVNATITLENVTIDVSGTANACAFDISPGANITLVLSETNTLKSGTNAAGLQTPEGSTLTITSISGDGTADGTLNATGGAYSAGIGGGYDGSGTITISGGTINATGGYVGAGIGGGCSSSSSTIAILDGTVNATGGVMGAGIGGSEAGAGTINISGGAVVAIAGSGGAIAGGASGFGGKITITGGTTIATGLGIDYKNFNTRTNVIIDGTPLIFATAINGLPWQPFSWDIKSIAIEKILDIKDRTSFIQINEATVNPQSKTISVHIDITIPANDVLTIPEGWTLHMGNNRLTNNSVIINNGTLNPSRPVYTVSFNTHGYGTAIEPIRNIGSRLAAGAAQTGGSDSGRKYF